MKANITNLKSYSKLQAIKEKAESRKTANTKSLKEAEEISAMELNKVDPEAYNFLKRHDLLKASESIWDGVHGKISYLKNANNPYSKGVRLEADDLKKIINDKQFRWLDVNVIGYGSGF